MNILHNQRGTLAFEVALVVLVLASIGSAVYMSHRHADTLDATVNVPHKKVAAQPVAKTVPTSVKPANEFDVPELGFKLFLPAGLQSLQYRVNNSDAGTGKVNGQTLTLFSSIDITTSALARREPNCTITSGNRGMVSIEKYNIDPLKVVQASPPSASRQINNYYIALGDKQSSCSKTDSDAQLELQQFHLIQLAFGTAQPL